VYDGQYDGWRHPDDRRGHDANHRDDHDGWRGNDAGEAGELLKQRR
jgi:hypothetical protein